MSALGWQVLVLVVVLLAIAALIGYRRSRPDEPAGRPRASFLAVSVLAHLGLLFLLDLVLISVPVVQAHKEFLEEVVFKAFSIGVRTASPQPWERAPTDPPLLENAVGDPVAPSSFSSASYAPELRDTPPTLPEAVARALPPERVLFVPSHDSRETAAASAALPRVVPVPTAEMTPAESIRLDTPPRVAESPLQPSVPAAEPHPVDLDATDTLRPKSTIREARPPPPDLAPLRSSRELASVVTDLPALPRAALAPADAPPPAEVSPNDAIARSAPTAPVPDPEPEIRVDRRSLELTLDRSAPMIPKIDPSRSSGASRAPLLARVEKAGTDLPIPELARLGAKRLEDPPVLDPEELEPAANFAMRKEETRKNYVAALGGDVASEAAVGRGLAWLASHQAADGHWSIHQLHCQNHACDAAGTNQSDPAATGLALMALLGAGHSHKQGSHAEVVARGLRWLATHQQANGDLSGGGGSRMYGHALATIAMCEALGLSGDPDLRAPAQKALSFIIDAQEPSTGGWRYEPKGGGDTSVFGWQLMALKSGEMAGLAVPSEVYQRAVRWLDAVGTGPDHHQYGYQPGRSGTPPMTAEALLSRQYLGLPRMSPGMIAGAEYLKQNLPKWESRNTYYWYYATQVMFHLQGDAWAAWNAKLRDMLVSAQAQDGPSAGSWSPKQPSHDEWGDQGGRLYETALALLILEVYYRHLPLYQQLGH